MTTGILAIGTYDERSRQGLEAMGAICLPDLAALDTLPPEVPARIAAIAYVGHHPLGAAAMDRFPGLGIIANYGVGYDAIDVAAATARGIRVTNTPDVLNDDVADLAVAMLLAQARSLPAAQDHVRSGAWAEHGEFALQRKVTGGRAGILGLGRIGREIADRLAAFKMDLHYHARSEKETPGWTFHADPVSLARAVDFLVVALVGGPATVGYVSRDVIEALGPRGVLINISRGTTVDEEALIEALQQGRIAGAGLDVFRNEPHIDPRFLTLGNVVLQPHHASGTVETRAAMAQLQRDNIAAFLAGQPLPTPVN